MEGRSPYEGSSHMRIRSIEIKNLRSIRHLAVDLGRTTVLVGPNNAGKTAILDAFRIDLTRRWDQDGIGFSEYDIQMIDDAVDPKTSDGISIELKSEGREPGEWPDTVTEDMGNVMQMDFATGSRSILLQTQCRWNKDTAGFEPTWKFLTASREPLVGKGVNRLNFERLQRYLPFFRIGELRNVADELSTRLSQFCLDTNFQKPEHSNWILESRILRD